MSRSARTSSLLLVHPDGDGIVCGNCATLEEEMARTTQQLAFLNDLLWRGVPIPRLRLR